MVINSVSHYFNYLMTGVIARIRRICLYIIYAEEEMMVSFFMWPVSFLRGDQDTEKRGAGRCPLFTLRRGRCGCSDAFD